MSCIREVSFSLTLRPERNYFCEFSWKICYIIQMIFFYYKQINLFNVSVSYLKGSFWEWEKTITQLRRSSEIRGHEIKPSV